VKHSFMPQKYQVVEILQRLITSFPCYTSKNLYSGLLIDTLGSALLQATAALAMGLIFVCRI
jgi:hypothetical protein